GSSKLVDVDRLAHIKDVGFSSFATCSGTQNQIHSFRNAHEEACGPWVSNPNGAALTDLVAKEPEHAPGTARNIAESYIQELRRIHVAVFFHGHFGQLLRKPHVARRIHGFISGNVDEALDPKLRRHRGHVTRSQHIVTDGFLRMKLHHADVL